MSEAAFDQAKQAFDESASVSVKADTLLQNLDVDALRQEAEDIKNQVRASFIF